MRWVVTGANRETGQDAKVVVDAANRDEAAASANAKGLLVTSVSPTQDHSRKGAPADKVPTSGATAPPVKLCTGARRFTIPRWAWAVLIGGFCLVLVVALIVAYERQSRELRDAKAQLDTLTKPQQVAPAAVAKPAGVSISGAAWISRRGGSSDVLRGLRVDLLPPNIRGDVLTEAVEDNLTVVSKVLEDERAKAKANGESRSLVGAWLGNAGTERGRLYQKVNNTRALMADMPEEVDTKYALRLVTTSQRFDIPDFRAVAHAESVATATANVDGKYSFLNVAPGEYFIAATFDSANGLAQWLIPVTVAGTPLSVDLYNDTAIAIRTRDE